MKLKKEIQTAWEISVLLHWLSDLLWERYEDDFADMDLHPPQDPCLGPLGPIDPPDKTEREARTIRQPTRDLMQKDP